MEFHEKLQELRKNRGLTQEELAREIYVSRTAISKWESGKGYPSIDSLKELSRFFSVTIDDLLSSEELMSAAQDETRSKLRQLCDLLIGITDLMHIALILLPLYPARTGEEVAAVSLIACADAAPWIRCVYWSLPVLLLCLGLAKVIPDQKYIPAWSGRITCVSLTVSILAVLFLTMTRVPYAACMAFLLLVIKAVLLWKMPKSKERKL